MASTPLWARLLATVVGAATLSALVPPLNWHALHWVALLPMFWAMRPDQPRSNRWLAWLYGVVGVGMLFWWIAPTIVTFSPGMPRFGAYGVLILFSAVFGLPYVLLWPSVHPLRQRLGPAWVFAFPALQVLLEWASSYLLLFPYNHGVSQYRFPYIWQLASVTGVWGVTYLLFLVNSALAEAMYRREEGRPLPSTILATVGGIVAVVVLFGAWRYERVEAILREAPVLRVAQIQSDKGMEYRMSHPRREEFEWWLTETRAVPEGTDLAVWSEGACPYDLNDPDGRARKVLEGVARRKHLEMLVGGGTRVREPDPDMGEDRVVAYNSVFHFRPDGTVSAQYDKMVPLPFGEYLPFGSFAPGLGRSLGIGDFAAGEIPVVFDGEHAQMATPICYEAILGRICRRFLGADLFVNVTNDAWFGDTAAPHQHAMLAAVRSMELGVPMFRSAYTGVSLVVEPHGAIHYETAPYTEVSRVVQVRLGQVATLYRRFGDWFVVMCGLGLALGGWRTRPR